MNFIDKITYNEAILRIFSLCEELGVILNFQCKDGMYDLLVGKDGYFERRRMSAEQMEDGAAYSLIRDVLSMVDKINIEKEK